MENVKKEPETTNVSEKTVEEEYSEPEPDFLDELLNSANDIASSVSDKSKSTNTKVKPEPVVNADEEDRIDPSFFDEILTPAGDNLVPNPVIRKKHRVKREYIDLEDGEVEEDHHVRDKSKKSKKSKRKKDKEFSKKIKTEKPESPSTATAAATDENKAKPRLQVRAEFRSFREPTPTSPPPQEEEEPPKQIETHIGNSRRYQPIPFQFGVLPEEPIEQKPEVFLSAEEKLCRALEQIMYAKREFQIGKLQNEKKFYANDPVFAYTPTVRKLPTSFSHFTQQIYDNRSPLHTVNNVTFQFNSMATRLNLEEWGLETLPSKAKAVARTLSYDVDTLFMKKQSIKIPDKIQKSIECKNKKTEEKEVCEKSNSTLFMNVMVQTDDVKVIPNRRRDFYRDIGLQSTPSTYVIGTQTNPVYTGEGAELPLFKIIRKLNENQLCALDDFLMLILEPSGTSSMDLYQQRKRLADIYKTSQIPAEPAAPSSHKRSASRAGLSERTPSPPPPPSIYKNRDFIKREPREADDYHQPSERRRSSHASTPPRRRGVHSRPISPASFSNGESSSSVKYYGRGGMRR